MGIKILLADDSVTAQNMGKKILSEAGHEVVTVSNGAAAAKKIAEIKPNLVLLDVFMPGYNGLELCEKLRAATETAKLPVLLTVGRMEPYNPQDGAKVKADGVIVKPFEASDLIAAVERLVQKLPAVKPIEPKASEPKPTEPKHYEQTMRLDAAQIAAMLNSASAAKQAPVAETEEFQVAAAAPSADAGLPAFAQDLETTSPAEASFAAEHAETSSPAYSEQYLSETPAFAIEPSSELATAAPSFQPVMMDAVAEPTPQPAVEMPVADQLAATMVISKDELLHRFDADVKVDAPVASAEGLELTAAAPVPDFGMAAEPGFEATAQSSVDAPTMMMKDPAFVSDPHEATTGFATQFGIAEHSPSPEFAAHTETSEPVDDFQARLDAVMASSYEDPAAELSLPIPAANDIVAAPVDDFEAKLEQALHTFDSPEEPVAEASELHMVEPQAIVEETHVAAETETVVAHSSAPEVSNVVEFTSSLPELTAETVEAAPEQEELTTVDAVSTTVVSESHSEHLSSVPDTDEAVIEQMREGLAHLPVDYHAGESAPMAMAAAAGVAPASAPSPLGREAELEISRSLGAAMGIDHAASESNVTPINAATGDANNVAEAVEKVMQRELPNLIWKIMAEIDLRKR